MKKGIVIFLLAACMISWLTDASVATSVLESGIVRVPLGEILGKDRQLTWVEKLPSASDVTNVVVLPDINAKHGGTLTADSFKTLIEKI